MKGFRNVKVVVWLIALVTVIGFSSVGLPNVNAQEIWVTAYYGGWMQGGPGWTGHMTADKIDYSAITHIIHFYIKPNFDATIDYSSGSITPENSNDLIKRAKAAGKKVLISIGGWDTEQAFLSATSDANRQKFIANLINFMVSRGYDGIDFDWEPISATSVSRIKIFITELRAEMDKITPRPLLTAAAVWEPGLFAQLQDKFDQINIMTYDLAGLWMNATWFNAPTYDGGYWFQTTGAAPSANGLVDYFISSGVKKEKLGIGMGFYGYVWKGGSGTPTGGVTAPGQKWSTAPSLNSYVNYYEIMDKYYQPAYYRYDAAAGSSYLSIDKAGSADDMFISYNDEATAFEKVKYIRNKGIGGLMIFEIGGGWRPNTPVPDALLQSVKNAVIQTSPSNNLSPSSPVLLTPSNGSVGIPTSTMLNWQSSSGATSYVIQLSKNSSFTDIVAHSELTSTSFSISNLTNNTVYYWRVQAKNANSSSNWSNVWSFTTESNIKTIIVNFKGTVASNGIMLTWQTTVENNNKGFDIERKLSSSNTWTKIGYVAGAGQSNTIKEYNFTDTTAQRKRTYNYRLKQINVDNTFTYSEEITLKR
ncbi:MAG: glycoside hydrolase family 18 protein [Thermodesulfovibrionales bacterium]|nr:glycoside hydrolase family 18 protein [Thermodesulfovibrionales bacterium]